MYRHSETLLLLKRLIYLSAKTQDIKKLKKFVVTQLGKKFNADRCLIRDYDPVKMHFLEPEAEFEYVSGPEVKTLTEYSFLQDLDQVFVTLLKGKKMLIIDDADDFIKENELENTVFEDFIIQFSIKSGIIYLVFSYQGELIGLFALHYTKEKIKLSDEDVQFIKAILLQAATAIHHIKQYETIKQNAERESLLKDIILTLRSTLELDSVKKYFVDTLGEYLKADRVLFIRFDRKRNIFLSADEASEYLSDPDSFSFVGYDWNKDYTNFFLNPIIEGKEVNFSNLNKYATENNLEDSELIRLFKQANVYSSYNVPIVYENQVMGYFCIDFKEPDIILSKEDLDFIRTLANQIGTAMNQAKLYEDVKQTAERERLLRKVSETIRETLDIKETIKKSVTEIAKTFNADRCYISEYDEKIGWYKPVESNAEYLATPETKSLEGYDWSVVPEIGEIFRLGKESFSLKQSEVYEKCIEIGGIELFQKAQAVLEKYNIKFAIGISIFYRDKFLGVLAFNYNVERALSEEELNLARTLAGQIGVAMNQAKLYEDVNETAERERLLRKIGETIRETLDIKETIKKSVTEIAKTFNADRCFISEYDEKTGWYKPLESYAEYLATPETKSQLGFDWSPIPEVGEIFRLGKESLYSKQSEVYEKCIEIDGVELAQKSQAVLDEYNIKSAAGIPIFYRDKFLGVLGFNYNVERELSEEELNLARTLAGQIGVAMNQARLYEREKQTAGREVLLRKTIEILRSTFYVDIAFNALCEEIGRFFNTERVTITTFSTQHPEIWEIIAEYKSSEKIKGPQDIFVEKRIPSYVGSIVVNNENMIINNVLKEEMPEYLRKFYTTQRVKSVIGISLKLAPDKWAGLFLASYEKYHEWNLDEIELLQSISNQVYIAQRQANLYIKEKQTAEREKLLREVIEVTMGSVNIKQVRQNIVNTVGETFNADRCYLRVFDKIADRFYPPDVEYLGSSRVESLLDKSVNQEGLSFFVREAEREKESSPLIVNQELMQKKNLFNTPLLEYFEQAGIKTDVAIPMWDREDELSFLVLHFVENIPRFSEEETNLMETIAKQTVIAINQAKLYENIKNILKREKLQRKFAEIVRSTLDIDQFKKIAVEETGKAFNADRCFIAVYDKKSGSFKKPDIQYLSSPNLNKIETFEPYQESIKLFAQIIEEKSGLYVGDTESFIEENHLENTETEDYYKRYSIKSDYSLQTWETDEEKAFIVIQYTDKSRYLTPEEVGLHKYLANQTATAFNQAQLYENERKTAERERLLREIIQTIRSTLDIDETLSIICDEVAKAYNVQRATIVEYPRPEDYKNWVVKREYKKGKEIKGLSDINYEKRTGEYIGAIVVKDDKNLIINNIPESDAPDYFKKNYTEMGAKAVLSVPVKRGDDKWGIIFLSDYEKYRHWTEEEITLLENIADQTYIAINQANLYTTVRKTAERERLLRQIYETIRSTIDINEIEESIVRQIGMSLNAQRVFIIEYDETENKFLPAKHEYLSFPELKSFIGYDIEKRVPEILDRAKKENIIIENTEKFLLENNLQDSLFAYHLRDMETKSSFSIPLYYADRLIGLLAIHFTEREGAFGRDEVDFVKTLAGQIAIAINQASLYEDIRKTAERERLQREIVAAIRSTLDINEIKNHIVTEIGRAMQADRCQIVSFDSVKDEFLPLDEYSEYLMKPEEQEFKDYDWTAEDVQYYLEPFKRREELHWANLETFLQERGFIGKPEEKFPREFNILSTYNFPIVYADRLLGFFGLDYTRQYVALGEQDLNFLRSLINQVAIGLHQARLYETVRRTADREKLLREIVSEIKISQSLEEAYNYVLKKFTDIFNTDRCVFIDVPHYIYEKPSIKYEYLRNENLPSIKNKRFPDYYTVVFQRATEAGNPFIINESLKKIVGEEKSLEFSENCFTKSALAVPLIRYNRDRKVLGIIALCSFVDREWSEEEKELLEAITKTVVNVVWDISKLVEIEELRNTFMLTLAHDLQVPVIGEEKALEYVNLLPEETEIKDIKPILEELADNNKSINITLSKLIDIYNYEMGNKKLEYSIQSMEKLASSAYEKLKGESDAKSLKVNFQVKETLPEIRVDKKEIEKVLGIILENAIEYSPENGEVLIKLCKVDHKNAVVCISDNGPGFPPAFEELVFKRYEMIKVLGRKIGAGLSLYLAKLIIQEHGGYIKIDSKEGQGTTFCVYIPIAP